MASKPTTQPDGEDPDGPDADQTWEAARRELARSLPPATFDLWIEPLRAVGFQGPVLLLTAPAGVRTWAERRYRGLISEALRTSGSPKEIAFVAQDAEGESAAINLNPEYTFDRFVIGAGNRLAHAAALAVAEAPSESYNPLFLHGPPGLGKTHLLTAIANYLREEAPSLTVRYTTAESFTNEFVGALHASGIKAFKRRFRDIDVLLIDDVQALEGKQHTEEEFFHTFNALYEGGSQIVLSADRVPNELAGLATRLRDRFEWGLTVPLHAPDLPTRMAVLRRLVREAGIDSNEGALAELAGRIDLNIRQLHGALTRVLAHSSLLSLPISSDLIADVIPGRAPRPAASVSQIIDVVASFFDVEPLTVRGPARSGAVLKARKVAIFLTRELTDLSLLQIGQEFSGRDHSTVLNSIRRIEAEQAADPVLRAQLSELRSTLLHNEAGPAT